MADTIEVTTTVDLVTWPTPDYVSIGPSDIAADEGADGVHCTPVETAPQTAVDALVERWLTNLYARRQEANPWELKAR